MTTILHVIPSLEGGGAERQLTMLAIEQVRRGWTVHVALRRGGVHEEAMRDGGALIHRLGDLRSIHPLLIARLAALVRKLGPDVMQTWLPQMDIVGGLATSASSVPWVLSERASKEAYPLRYPAMAWLRALLARRARMVVANSLAGADYWKDRIRPGALTVIENAVDVATIRGAATIDCVPPDWRVPVVLLVGRLTHQKAPEIFVEAVARLPSSYLLHALLLGDGPLHRDVIGSINAHGLAKRVKVVPYRTDWWGMLKTATAVVSTSRFEGQPNVVLEAMAAGCPLIVSSIAPHLAILDDESALIVPQNDPGAVADAMAALLSDPVSAQQRVERAAQRVERMTIQFAADRYEQVYARLAGGSSG